MADTAWRLAAQEDGERVRKLQASIASLTAEIDAAATQVDALRGTHGGRPADSTACIAASEGLMRLLLRLDALTDLPPWLSAERKAQVGRIQHLLRQVDATSKSLAPTANPAISTFGNSTSAQSLAQAAAVGEPFPLAPNNPFAPEPSALAQSFTSFSFSHSPAGEIDLEEALGLKPKPSPAAAAVPAPAAGAAAAAGAAYGGIDLALSPSIHDEPSALFPSSHNTTPLPPPPGARAAAAAAAALTEAERKAEETGRKGSEAGKEEREKRQQHKEQEEQQEQELGPRKVRFENGVKAEDAGREAGRGRTGGSSGNSGRREGGGGGGGGGARGTRLVPQMHVPSPDSEIVQFSTFASFAGQRPLLHVTPKSFPRHGRREGAPQQAQAQVQVQESGSAGKGSRKEQGKGAEGSGQGEGGRVSVNSHSAAHGSKSGSATEATVAAAAPGSGVSRIGSSSGGGSSGGSSGGGGRSRKPAWMKAPAASTELSTFPMSAVFRNPPPVVPMSPETAEATATAATAAAAKAAAAAAAAAAVMN
ncbi:unnamed protein product [Closterium sp. NIES-53]